MEFVIVFLQGAREQAEIGDWISGLAQVHYNPEGFGIETYTFMDVELGLFIRKGRRQ